MRGLSPALDSAGHERHVPHRHGVAPMVQTMGTSSVTSWVSRQRHPTFRAETRAGRAAMCSASDASSSGAAAASRTVPGSGSSSGSVASTSSSQHSNGSSGADPAHVQQVAQLQELVREQSAQLAALQRELSSIRTASSIYPSAMTLDLYRALPERIILVRHAQSAGNLDASTYASTPDYEVPLSAEGMQQALDCGVAIKRLLDDAYLGRVASDSCDAGGSDPCAAAGAAAAAAVAAAAAADAAGAGAAAAPEAAGAAAAAAALPPTLLRSRTRTPPPYRVFFLVSPYCRTRQTYVGLRQAFEDREFGGIQEEVQLREQDFGNFQHPAKIQEDIRERNRFGRFYYRFPDGESSSDVYNRISIFEDHLIRDMRAGRYGCRANLVIISHGLTIRLFMMRFFNWAVETFLQVHNPPNAQPIVIEKITEPEFMHRVKQITPQRQSLQIKQVYRLRPESQEVMQMTQYSLFDNMDLVHQEFY